MSIQKRQISTQKTTDVVATFVTEKTKKLHAEIANGRLAMVSIIGTFIQDGLTGSAWGDGAIYVDSPPRALENELGAQPPVELMELVVLVELVELIELVKLVELVEVMELIVLIEQIELVELVEPVAVVGAKGGPTGAHRGQEGPN